MLQSNTAREQILTTPDVKQVVTGWFAALAERREEFAGNWVKGRAWRAELRRMPPPYGVMMCEGYAALRDALLPCIRLEPIDQLALALFASVAVHVTCDNTDRSFAAQLGSEIKGRVCLSRLRFERLQRATDPQTFCQQLIRAVKLRGSQGVNIVSLADGIFLWMQEWLAREEHRSADPNPFRQNRIRWASEYLSTASKK